MTRTRSTALPSPRRSERIKQRRERIEAENSNEQNTTQTLNTERRVASRRTARTGNQNLSESQRVARRFYQNLESRHHVSRSDRRRDPSTSSDRRQTVEEEPFLFSTQARVRHPFFLRRNINQNRDPSIGEVRNQPTMVVQRNVFNRFEELMESVSLENSVPESRSRALEVRLDARRVVRPGTPIPDMPPIPDDAFSQPRRFRLRIEPNSNPVDPEDSFRLENHSFWGNVLAFNELLGFERMRPGMTQEQIECIPEKTFKATRSSRHESCHVCLVDFANNETLKRLPKCGHEFHVECLKPWLEKHTTCPVCRETAN